MDPTRHQLYGHLPPITKTIQVRRTRHAGHCWRSRDELIRDVLLWIPTHGAQKQDDQHERTFSSYVRIQVVVLKTCLGRWTIGRSGERGSGISVLPARYDDDDDDDIYIYIYTTVFDHLQKLLFLTLKVLFLIKQDKHHKNFIYHDKYKSSSATLTLDPISFEKLIWRFFSSLILSMNSSWLCYIVIYSDTTIKTQEGKRMIKTQEGLL